MRNANGNPVVSPRDFGCLQQSIDEPRGVLVMPAIWTDPETDTAIPADARCVDCGELRGQHRHLACCVEICVCCGEASALCVCPGEC